MDKIKEIRRFFLLQVNDALFPIGGYSHSQGLETYIQQGIVHDEETAAEYIGKKLKLNLACTDLLGVRLAYEYALKEDVAALDMLEEILGHPGFQWNREKRPEKWVPVLQRQSVNCLRKIFLWKNEVFLKNIWKRGKENR